MRKMSDTIARLAALRAQQATAPLAGRDRLADLARFGSNPGALRARFYIPKDLPSDAPLVVILHGCTQSAAGYDHGSGWSQLADQAGFALLYPEQQRANNTNLCFNWFLPGDIKRNSGEALSIRQMIETLVVTHGLDRRRIFIAGLSAGGAMASVMLATYPEVFAGGAIIAGLAYGSASTIPEAFDRMRGHGGPSEQGLQQLLHNASQHKGPWPKISIWHGLADATVVPSNADAIAAQWRSVHRLGRTPSFSITIDGRTTRSWRDEQGRTLIEIVTIAGMGHGTPLKTNGEEGLGAPASFMLDVGISSTRQIAQFWGIANATINAAAAPQQDNDAGNRRPSYPVLVASSAPAQQPAVRSVSPTPAHQTNRDAVRTIIEDALRSAGLLRSS